MIRKEYISPACYVVNIPCVTFLLSGSPPLEEKTVKYYYDPDNLDLYTEEAL